MRKSFTRLFSIFILLTLMSFQALLAQVLSPVDHFTNVRPGATETVFTITFPSDVEVNSGAGIVSLNRFDTGTNSPVEIDPIQVTDPLSTSAATGSTVEINGSVVTITFKSTLLEQQWYYITVSSHAFKYVSGGTWAGLAAVPTVNPATNSGNYDWDFGIGDFTTPTAVLTPRDNSIHAGYALAGNPPNTELIMVFDEDIQFTGGGSIGLYNGPINPDDAINIEGNVVDLIENIPATAAPAVLNIGGYTITIDTDGSNDAVTGLPLTHNRITVAGLSNLTDLANYYVRITRGTILDMSGNPEGDFMFGTNDDVYDNNTTWNFRAADNTPPTVAMSIPSEAAYLGAGLTNVSKTPSLVLTFSDDRTANGLAFTLQKSTSLYNDAATPGSAAVAAVVAGDLNKFITVTGGAVTINWAGATMSGNVATIPLTGLATHTTYTVTVNGGGSTIDPQDGEGNEIATTAMTFKTGDFTKPQFLGATLQRNSDADQLVDVFVDDDTQINDRNQPAPYNEPLNIYVMAVANNATAPTAAAVKAANKKLTWDAVQDRYELENHNFGLTCDTEYDFYFYAEDVANSMSGINVMSDADVAASKIDLHATDNCFNEPTISFSAGTASAVGRNATIDVTFDEEVKSANWNTAITLTVPDGTFGAPDGNRDPVTFTAVLDGTKKIVTITETNVDEYDQDGPGDDFAAWLSNTGYELTFDKDLFTDDASGADGSNTTDDDPTANYGSDNKLAGDKMFTFTTEDYQGPIATFNPVDGSGIGDPLLVDIGVNPTITFDEPIYTENTVAITNANIVGGAQDYVELIEVGGVNPNVPATITIDATGKIVTIVPTVALKSEQQYRVKISTLIEDANGYPVFKYMNTGIDIESFAVPASTEADFETEDTQVPTIAITAVDKGDALNVAPDTDRGVVAVPNDAEFRITFAEGVREVASSTLISAADENMIRSLITLTGPSGQIEFNVIEVINPATAPPGAPANNNATVVYIDPIDYGYTPEYLYTAGANYTVDVSGVEDDNSNPASASQVISIFEVASTPTITLLSSVPSDNAVDVALANQKLILNFDIAVGANANNIVLNPGAVNIVANSALISNNSKTFTYNLPTPLTSDASYTITIPVNTFTGLDGAVPPQWPSASYDIDFATVDETAPTIDLDTDIAALSGAALNAVHLDDKIIFTFDSNIQKISGDVWVKRVDNGTTVAQLTAGSGGLTVVNNNELHLNLSYATLAFNTTYFIEMDGTVVGDMATTPNAFEWQRSISGTGTFYAGGFYNIGAEPQGNVQFTTWADTPVPTYTFAQFLPAPGSDDVSQAYTPFVIKLSGDVTRSTNLAVGDRQLDIINETDGNNTEFSIDMYGPGVSVSGSTITIDPFAQFSNFSLAADADYEINLDPNVLVKNSGTTSPPLAGFNSDFGTTTNWYFTTEDNTKPRIASVTFDPANNGTSVDKAAKIIVTFTEPVVLTAANWDAVFDFNNYGAPAQGADGTVAVGTAAEVGSTTMNAGQTELTITLDAILETDADARTITMTVNAATFTDVAGNANVGDPYDVAGDATFVVVDERKPTFTAFTDNGNLLSPTETTAIISVDTDEDVTVYVLAVADGATAPTDVQVMAGQSFTCDASNNPKTYTYTGLTACGDYDFYVLAVDGVGNASDAGAGAGDQPNGPVSKQTSDTTAPSILSTVPADEGTMQVFTQRYGTTDTPILIFFNEPIAWTGVTPNFRVREYETNVDVGVTPTITNDGVNSKYYVSLVPTAGDWAANTHYYVEMDYGIIEDVPCNASVPNEYDLAYYGKEEFDFTTGPLYTAPTLTSITPNDGQDMVTFGTPDWLEITYDEPVQINYAVGTPIYIYQYDDPGTNPQEVIPVTPTFVNTTDNLTIKILLDNILTPTHREHYRVVLPANLIRDASYDAGDATTTNDLTPLNGNTNAANIGFNLLAEAAPAHAGGPWWDFWALDQTNPNYAWSSDWVDNYTPDNYGGDKINNFPISDARVQQEGDLTWDNLDNGIGDPAATRNIYLTFNEEIYIGGVALAHNANVTNRFTFKDALNNNVTFTAIFDLPSNTVTITPTSNYVSQRAYTVTVASGIFKDVHGNDLTAQGSTTYNFTAWLDQTPTVTVTAAISTYDLGRVAKRPNIYITFNRGILLANNYQPLRDVDIKDLVQVNGGTNYTIVSFDNNKDLVIQPNADLASESNLAVTIGGNPALVDDIRAYTLNSNLFTDLKTVNFTVEDYINPTVNVYHPTGTNVNPADPLGAWGAGNFLVVEFSENIAVDASVAESIEVRRAWVTGPQSQGAGSIFQLSGAADVQVNNGDELWIPITGGASATLEVFTGYYIKIPAGLIVDAAGLPYAGIANNTTWTFATDDGTPPTVIAANPAIDGRPSNFPVTENFWLQFDENIVRGAGNFVIYKRDPIHSDLDDGNAVEIIDAADPLKVLISGSDAPNGKTSDLVTIKHDDLDKGFIYYIRYDAGVVVDNNANNVPYRYDFTWDFTTSEHAQPVLLSVSPDGTTDESQEPVLTMTFDNVAVPIRLGVGDLRIYEYYYDAAQLLWDTKLVTTINSMDATQVSLSTDGVVTIDPTVKLDDNVANYYVLVDASFITNTTTGDFSAGIADDSFWTFGTADEIDAPVLATDGYQVNGTCLDPAGVQLTLTLEDYNGIKAGAGNFMIYEYVDGTNDVLAETIAAADGAKVTITSTADADNFYTTPLVVDITPTTLVEQKDYYVMVGANAIVDDSRGTTTGFDGSVIGVNEWKFSTDDVTAPDFVAASFGPVGIDEEADVTLTITFDEDVQPGTGMIKVLDGGTTVFESVLDASMISGAVVSVPVTGLADNTTFDVTYEAGFVKDLPFSDCGTTRECPAFAGVWNFTTDDNTAPTVLSITPDGGSVDQPNDIDFTVTFDENVQAGAGSITVHKQSDDAVVATVDVADLTIVNDVVTFSVTGLDDETGYYLLVDAGIVTDMALNPNDYEGVSDPTELDYTIGDHIAPTLLSATPDSGTDLDNEFSVTLEFSETVTNVDASVIVTGGTKTVTQVTGAVYTVAIASTDGATVTLDVANTVVDEASLALVGTYSYSFSVKDDTVEPTVSADPDSGTGMPNTFSVDVTFSEPVNGAASGITVNGATTYSVVGVNGDAVYTVNINAVDLADVTITVPTTVTDIAGNALAAEAGFSYTVGDHVAPTVTALSPLNEEIVAADPNDLVITFSEDVVAGSGSVTVYLGSGVQVEYDITDAVVSGNTVTISMAADDLLHNQTYFVYVENGFVVDGAGNAFAGITSPATWKFMTELNTAYIELVSGSLKVYPNPCTSSVTVESTNNGIISRAVFTNVAGQVVKDITVNDVSKTISTSNLRSGIYFVSLYDGKVIAKTERIVKR